MLFMSLLLLMPLLQLLSSGSVLFTQSSHSSFSCARINCDANACYLNLHIQIKPTFFLLRRRTRHLGRTKNCVARGAASCKELRRAKSCVARRAASCEELRRAKSCVVRRAVSCEELRRVKSCVVRRAVSCEELCRAKSCVV